MIHPKKNSVTHEKKVTEIIETICTGSATIFDKI